MSYELSNSIFNGIVSQTTIAVNHYDTGRYEDASAIINEWTTSSDQCILTNHLNDTIDTIEDELLYVTLTESEITYGTFQFLPEVELPIDNN